MHAQDPTILILARQVRLLEGLAALLAASKSRLHVHHAMNEVSAAPLIDRHHPGLIVLEGGPSVERTKDVIARLRDRSPSSRILVLTVDVAEREALLAAGADEAVVQGSSPTRLMEAIEALLGL